MGIISSKKDTNEEPPVYVEHESEKKTTSILKDAFELSKKRQIEKIDQQEKEIQDQANTIYCKVMQFVKSGGAEACLERNTLVVTFRVEDVLLVNPRLQLAVVQLFKHNDMTIKITGRVLSNSLLYDFELNVE